MRGIKGKPWTVAGRPRIVNRAAPSSSGEGGRNKALKRCCPLCIYSLFFLFCTRASPGHLWPVNFHQNVLAFNFSLFSLSPGGQSHYMLAFWVGHKAPPGSLAPWTPTRPWQPWTTTPDQGPPSLFLPPHPKMILCSKPIFKILLSAKVFSCTSFDIVFIKCFLISLWKV